MDPIAAKIAREAMHRVGTPVRVAARYYAATSQFIKIKPNDPNVEEMTLRKSPSMGWEYSVKAPKGATHGHGDKKNRASARQKLRYMMRNSMNLTNADRLLKELDEAFDKKYEGEEKTAGGLIGPGGLMKTEDITLQKGAMYALGASSSPSLVILTDVTDEKVRYVNYPFDGPAYGLEAWVAKDLLSKGTRTYLRTYGAHMDSKLKSSMESLLKGGKGITENMNDWKRVVIHAVAADAGKDEWRAAEEYGDVGGRDDEKYGMVYEIKGFQKEVPKIKKDKRLKVLKVVNA